MTDSNDISSSKDGPLHTCNRFLQPEELEKEIKKKKKSERPNKKHSKRTLKTSQLQSEFHHLDLNTTFIEGVTKSEKVNLWSNDRTGTQNFAATNQARAPKDESAVFRKEKKYRKPRRQAEEYTGGKAMKNINEEHQNMDSLGTGSKKRKKAWKSIPSKVTYTNETQITDIAHEEYFAVTPRKKRSRRKRKEGPLWEHNEAKVTTMEP